ncbi:SRPBCC family protein [Streptacidiphilus sp. PB12-B1b]|uniref:SRPBCC family protein n=1 Tax=Streptacidiphilus sp. PB12-B1b TaxID=2705012 RepID=UPI0015FA25D3|nr:SRPBCC family protein [Streptacidiphilus sp. PB12-B1b]QMU76298.1 SRPBCC family protein [Streptacidiphilus sp. PB12-B1b]
MAKRLRPVSAEFLGTAPARLVFTARLRSGPEAVFRELTEDASTMPLWFREVRSAAYTGAPPFGVGAGRSVTLRGGAHFVERVVAWREPERFVYRVEQTSLPGVRAWMEEWLLAPGADGGAVLRFTIAADAAPALRAALRLGRPGVARAVRQAVARLDERCGAARPRPPE